LNSILRVLRALRALRGESSLPIAAHLAASPSEG